MTYDDWKLASPYEQTPAEIAAENRDRDFERIVRAAAKDLDLVADVDCEDGRATLMICGTLRFDDVAPVLALMASQISNSLKRRRG